MTIQSSREQAASAANALPRMNVQQEIQKGLQQDDRNVGNANIGASANKQVLAANANVRPTQTPQQTASLQISKGYLDIKV